MGAEGCAVAGYVAILAVDIVATLSGKMCSSILCISRFRFGCYLCSVFFLYGVD